MVEKVEERGRRKLRIGDCGSSGRELRKWRKES